MRRWDPDEGNDPGLPRRCLNCGAEDHLVCESYSVPEPRRPYEIRNDPPVPWWFVALVVVVVLGIFSVAVIW